MEHPIPHAATHLQLLQVNATLNEVNATLNERQICPVKMKTIELLEKLEMLVQLL